MDLEFQAHSLGGGRSVAGEGAERGFERAFTSRADLPPDRIVIVEVECPDERPERQPLHDEGPDDHGKRRQDDEVAEWERCFADALWKGERRGQRDDAAHAGPRNDQAAADGRGRYRSRWMEA